MAKSNTNGNGADVTNGCAITPTIHLILQGKGGVGKTIDPDEVLASLPHSTTMELAGKR